MTRYGLSKSGFPPLATRCNLYYIDLYYIVTMIRNQRSTANSVEEFRSLGSCGEMSHGEGVAVA